MKAVMANVPTSLLESRRRTGADRWDEVWDGVLHMPPMPNREHQDLEGAMETWLRQFWGEPHGNKVYHQINVASPGGWPNKDYRIPDLVLLTPDRLYIDHNEYFDGGPTVVVEIRSPNDETYEKLDFYAAQNVAEVWVIDRDSRLPEIHLLGDDGYVVQSAGDQGWLASPGTGVELRGTDRGELAMRMAGQPNTMRELP
jgi:Uma2 family endonuclease